MAEGLELGVEVLILVRAGVRDLAQGFCFTRQREREIKREICTQEIGSGLRGRWIAGYEFVEC